MKLVTFYFSQNIYCVFFKPSHSVLARVVSKTKKNATNLLSLKCHFYSGYNYKILTYRNYPSYISMVIIFFLSVRSNTAGILMN